MDFFKIKTGIEWQDRVIKQKVMPTSFFQYSPPVSCLVSVLLYFILYISRISLVLVFDRG
jgi:hypothetical protein